MEEEVVWGEQVQAGDAEGSSLRAQAQGEAPSPGPFPLASPSSHCCLDTGL